ncbi:hypothetical protein B0H10DRAFT_2220346 [Mycena sp. CBHHK59/15]|nr:hypothetical protein B0H10DRAFT_2220346 [Mycena sp. CBHHK59/15]
MPSTVFTSFFLLFLMAIIFTTTRAHVLQSLQSNDSDESNLISEAISLASSSPFVATSMKSRRSEGNPVDKIIVMIFLIGLLKYFIFNLALVVFRPKIKFPCRLKLDAGPLVTKLDSKIAGYFRCMTPHRMRSEVIPLHHAQGPPQPPAQVDSTPTPPPHALSHGPSMPPELLRSDTTSERSLAVSETSTAFSDESDDTLQPYRPQLRGF